MFTYKHFILVLCTFGLLFGISQWSFEDNASTTKKSIASQTHSIQPKQEVIKAGKHQDNSKVQQAKAEVSLERLVPWQMGTEYNYQLILSNKMTIVGNSADEQHSIGISLDGNLALAVIEEDLKTVVLRAEIENLRLQLDNNRVDEATTMAEVKAKLQKNLVTPFYLVLARNGRVKSVRVPSALSTISATLLRSIASNLQFIHPQWLKPSWQYTEQDHVGEYLAQYQKINQGVYKKSKSSYEKIVTPEGLIATENIGRYQIDSQSTFNFSEYSELKSITATEIISAQVMAGFQIDTEQVMELTLLDREEITAKIPEWVNAMKQIAVTQLAALTPGEDPHRKSQEQLLNNANIQTLIADLRSLDFADEEVKVTNQEIMAVRRKLTALFSIHPETAEQALAEFDKEMHMEQLSILAGALASAETPQAQSVLGDVALKEDLGTDLRTTALALLGMSSKPTETTVDTLFMLQKSDEESLSTTANLALGGLTEIMAKQNPEIAEQIVTSLLQNFETSASDETRLMSLEALGNTGDKRIIPGIETILKDGSEALRSSGVEALRFVKTEKAVELIANTLDHDGQSSVRQAAIRAMDYQPIEKFLPNLIKVAHIDEDSSVRLQIVDRTGERLSEHTEGKELLIWLADNDPDATVREHAVEHVCNFDPDSCGEETQTN